MSKDVFDDAERYSKQALRQDPENSQAYMAKLMAQLKVHNALIFAGDDEKTAIQKYLDDNAEPLAASTQEQQKIQDEEHKQKETEALEKSIRMPST